MPDAPTDWRVIASEGLRVRNWGGEFVVYNPFSGNTHYLDEITGSVLASIAAGRGAEAELLELVDSMIEYADAEARVQNLRFMITVLVNLGLIEPRSTC